MLNNYGYFSTVCFQMFCIIFPNRHSCVRDIRRVIICLYPLKTGGTEGLDTEFMRHLISRRHCIFYQGSQILIPMVATGRA